MKKTATLATNQLKLKSSSSRYLFYYYLHAVLVLQEHRESISAVTLLMHASAFPSDNSAPKCFKIKDELQGI